jgi:hypothetical protein
MTRFARRVKKKYVALQLPYCPAITLGAVQNERLTKLSEKHLRPTERRITAFEPHLRCGSAICSAAPASLRGSDPPISLLASLDYR